LITRIHRAKHSQADSDTLREFANPDPIAWIQEHFYIPETRAPLQLEPYQAAVLGKALSKDENGLFNYSVIVWSDVKKSAKSTIAAAIALWMAFQVEWGQIVIVANDLKQADSRVGYYIRRAIELNPKLKNICKIRYLEVNLPNRTLLEAVPIDPSGEAGGNADMIVFSELWGAHQKAQMRMWTEATLSPVKFGRSFRWIETYAGFSGESLLLEQLYQQGTREDKGASRLDLWEGVDTYENKAARLFCMWNTTGLMPWHSKEYLAQEAAVLMPNEFSRLHKNQWVSSEEAFVPIEWWDACRGDQIFSDEEESWIIAADAGVSDDYFALVAVSRHPDAIGHTVLRYARAWKPPKNGKIDFQGTEENPGPEREIRRLFEQRNVDQMAYDPMQLEDMAGRLRKEGIGWVRPFGQASPRLISDSQLRQMIRDRRIHHSGEFPDLREHLVNANAKVDPEEHKIRIVKRSPLLKIDLAVALSMANAECMRLNL
jgi:phage terminase large subunit-like protein